MYLNSYFAKSYFGGIFPSLLEEYTATLLADAGLYTLAGIDINLTKQSKIYMEQGVYSSNGMNAILARHAQINPEQGLYTLAGIDTILAHHARINLEQGIYTLVGMDIELTLEEIIITLTLFADSGDYSLVGTDTNLTKQSKIYMEQGFYYLTGMDIETINTHIFPLEFMSIEGRKKKTTKIASSGVRIPRGIFGIKRP